MSVRLLSNIGFTSEIPESANVKVQDNVSKNSYKTISEQRTADSFENKNQNVDTAANTSIQSGTLKTKTNTFKNRVASIAKFFTATEEITKGTAKGAIYGTLTGGLIMACGWLFDALPKSFNKGNSIIKVFKHPFQSVSSKTKITAGLVTAGIAAYHIIRGFLQANQRRAFIDQKLRNNNQAA